MWCKKYNHINNLPIVPHSHIPGVDYSSSPPASPRQAGAA